MIHQAVHATPGNVALIAPTQGAVPQPGHFPSECHEARTVVRYTKVTHVSADHSLEVLALFGNGAVHTFLELQLQGLQLASESLGTGSAGAARA